MTHPPRGGRGGTAPSPGSRPVDREAGERGGCCRRGRTCPGLDQPDADVDTMVFHMHAAGGGVQEDVIVQDEERRCHPCKRCIFEELRKHNVLESWPDLHRHARACRCFVCVAASMCFHPPIKPARHTAQVLLMRCDPTLLPRSWPNLLQGFRLTTLSWVCCNIITL
jgi:hypothetical protein